MHLSTRNLYGIACSLLAVCLFRITQPPFKGLRSFRESIFSLSPITNLEFLLSTIHIKYIFAGWLAYHHHHRRRHLLCRHPLCHHHLCRHHLRRHHLRRHRLCRHPLRRLHRHYHPYRHYRNLNDSVIWSAGFSNAIINREKCKIYELTLKCVFSSRFIPSRRIR